MIFVDNEMTVFYDIDDTLILWNEHKDEKTKTRMFYNKEILYIYPNQDIVDNIRKHKVMGHYIVVWSSGGAEWAKRVVETLNINNIVDLIIAKPHRFADDLHASQFMDESKRINPFRFFKKEKNETI